ncbi:MAG: ParB/RepB/Spo0J family partition protein [Pseudoclavibacter sp.]
MVAAPVATAEKPVGAPAKKPAGKGATAEASTVEPTASGAEAAEAAGAEQIAAVQVADAVDADLLPTPGARLVHLDPNSIVPNAWQPRREFDEEALDELTHSVREFGVLQPIVVRPIPDDHPLLGEAEYELIMGERRLRATKAAGLERIPAILKDTPNDDMLRDALLENLHRSELNPLEEASAYQQLLEDFGITQEQLAQRIGRSRPQISNTMRLLKLPIDVQRRVAAGVLSAGHARAILSAGEPAAMTQLADKIVNEDLSVRAAEAAASKSGTRSTSPSSKAQSGGLTGYLDEVGERLGDRLNTRVKATLRRTKGQIVIDFASVADLNRILVELGEDPTGGKD